jgi:hypothetical protein
MIVKVQISQFTSDGVKTMLVYDKSRKHEFEDVATKEVLEIMKGRPKLFFEAELVDDPQKKGAKRINITKETKWQNW